MEYEAKSEHTPKEQQRKYQGKGNCSEFCGAMLEIIPKSQAKMSTTLRVEATERAWSLEVRFWFTTNPLTFKTSNSTNSMEVHSGGGLE